MTQQQAGLTLFPEWLKKAVELGYSPIELARVLQLRAALATDFS